MKVAGDNSALEGALSGGAPGCVLVPTMGALHAGHGALIRQGVELARTRGMVAGCVVSIFVNPTQFNEKADFERYPRTLEADLAVCDAAGASVVYAPRVEDVYPPSHLPPVPPLPAVATSPRLEDAHRPGHFAGVCQVVKRLFDVVRPGVAVFGEKDWQQLAVIRAMVAQERMDLEVIGAPTVREPDGLAMSSRNRFLTEQDRARALAISRALAASNSVDSPDEAEALMCTVLARAGITPEYAVVREAGTLMRPVGAATGVAWRALIAARVGSVRLIDNAGWIGGQV